MFTWERLWSFLSRSKKGRRWLSDRLWRESLSGSSSPPCLPKRSVYELCRHVVVARTGRLRAENVRGLGKSASSGHLTWSRRTGHPPVTPRNPLSALLDAGRCSVLRFFVVAIDSIGATAIFPTGGWHICSAPTGAGRPRYPVSPFRYRPLSYTSIVSLSLNRSC